MATKINGDLGFAVREHLIGLGLEKDKDSLAWGKAHDALRLGVSSFLAALGQIPDPSRDDTPHRVADMFVDDLCWGLDYSKFPKCTTTPNGVDGTPFVPGGEVYQLKKGERWCTEQQLTVIPTVGAYDEVVRVAKIQTISLCEHHFQTIIGWTHIAYIPNTEVLGLSKFARVTEFFARRPQIQERMTEQLYAALSFILNTPDIAVVQDCEHFCMKARGAMQSEASTQTSKMGGRFMSNASLRQEFLYGLR